MAVPQPKLAVVPTISAQAPEIVAANYDNPLSRLKGDSGQAIYGFGHGKGDGFGFGQDGGAGGATYIVGGDVSSPLLISKIQPEYTEDARRAKYSGIVHLAVVIDEHGVPVDIRIVNPLGLGLDEKAVEAVQRWRFRPGYKNGKPVKVRAAIDVNFRLL